MNKHDLVYEYELLVKAKRSTKYSDALYKYFVNDVYRFAYSLTGNQHDAEDITSQTFTDFYRNIHTYEWRGISLRYWFFQAVKHIASNKIRKDIKVESFDESYMLEEEYEVSFVDEVLNQDALSLVQKEISGLSNTEQAIINLRLWEDMSYPAIAQVLDSTEEACRKRFNRAINKIRESLKEKNVRLLISLPILFTAIAKAGSLPVYAAPSALIASGLGSLLIAQTTNTMMNITNIKALLFSNIGIAVTASTIALTAGGGVAAYSIAKRSDWNNEKQTIIRPPYTSLPTTSVTSTITLPAVSSISKKQELFSLNLRKTGSNGVIRAGSYEAEIFHGDIVAKQLLPQWPVEPWKGCDVLSSLPVLSLDKKSAYYVDSTEPGTVKKIDSDGEIHSVYTLPAPYKCLSGIYVDSNGSLGVSGHVGWNGKGDEIIQNGNMKTFVQIGTTSFTIDSLYTLYAFDNDNAYLEMNLSGVGTDRSEYAKINYKDRKLSKATYDSSTILVTAGKYMFWQENVWGTTLSGQPTSLKQLNLETNQTIDLGTVDRFVTLEEVKDNKVYFKIGLLRQVIMVEY